MKIKTNELIGAQLDWAVAKCEGIKVQYQPGFITYSEIQVLSDWDDALEYSPSTDWTQGGPIIEHEQIDTSHVNNDWQVWHAATNGKTRTDGRKVRRVAGGPTPLIAAMRCYVASKLGDEVEVPNGN